MSGFRTACELREPWLQDWLQDWLLDRLLDWLLDRLLDWLLDWLLEQSRHSGGPRMPLARHRGRLGAFLALPACSPVGAAQTQ